MSEYEWMNGWVTNFVNEWEYNLGIRELRLSRQSFDAGPQLWMNEWVNEWMNELTNKWISEWVYMGE